MQLQHCGRAVEPQEEGWQRRGDDGRSIRDDLTKEREKEGILSSESVKQGYTVSLQRTCAHMSAQSARFDMRKRPPVIVPPTRQVRAARTA